MSVLVGDEGGEERADSDEAGDRASGAPTGVGCLDQRVDE